MIQDTGKELTFLRATPTTTFSAEDSRECTTRDLAVEFRV
jgi:hypothetical protein